MATKLLTQQDYGRRIARAIALIAADPARNPGLEALAAAAAFSPYHFHRIYREITGETPADTLHRERLSHAAGLLVRGGQPVAAVARACGYGSAAAFTRAFRTAYGIPPAAYRDSGGIGLRLPIRPHEETTLFPIEIRQEAPLRLATLPHRGAYTAIGSTFDRLIAWAAARRLLGAQTRFIALYHDDPSSVAAKDLRSEAGLTVPEGVEGSEGVTIRDLPASRFAVLLFQGPYAELERAYTWLYRDWLPSSGEEPADEPVREEYLNDCRSLPPSEWLTAVMLPLRPRTAA
ncbi:MULTISPECIES: AraC family transcriptional regulator [Roseomonadaceae]|uniref:GyrI-like domain-containing protein n=1 Tax=Falsiroseomonas oleicola TaxID=2801474 RepID=A0ABS6H6S5_9PROT|nr:GyrI-like domain-containing protein [Roseomonas oleicola]MBU8543206.1 GyrI-like domain-containing protein [Roseomonas oleicola]